MIFLQNNIYCIETANYHVNAHIYDQALGSCLAAKTKYERLSFGGKMAARLMF